MGTVLTTRDQRVTELIKAMGIDAKNLVRVELVLEVDTIVTITAHYKQVLWVSDVQQVTEFFKRYELHEIP